MTTALTLSPVDSLSREAWRLCKYLRKYADGAGVLDAFRVEYWLQFESSAEAVGELMDASVLQIDDDDRYVLVRDGRRNEKA